MPQQFMPDWLDRRTAEWCAELCERVETRILPVEKRAGARACAAAIRAVIAGRAPLPTVKENSQ